MNKEKTFVAIFLEFIVMSFLISIKKRNHKRELIYMCIYVSFYIVTILIQVNTFFQLDSFTHKLDCSMYILNVCSMCVMFVLTHARKFEIIKIYEFLFLQNNFDDEFFDKCDKLLKRNLIINVLVVTTIWTACFVIPILVAIFTNIPLNSLPTLSMPLIYPWSSDSVDMYILTTLTNAFLGMVVSIPYATAFLLNEYCRIMINMVYENLENMLRIIDQTEYKCKLSSIQEIHFYNCHPAVRRNKEKRVREKLRGIFYFHQMFVKYVYILQNKFSK